MCLQEFNGLYLAFSGLFLLIDSDLLGFCLILMWKGRILKFSQFVNDWPETKYSEIIHDAIKGHKDDTMYIH